MTHREALEVLAAHRGSHVVITTHGSVDDWVALSDTPLDLHYVPTSMGQAPSLGLGLALARPERNVIVVNGDGATLMNLSCLVTIANYPANLFLIVMDNGVYEVTGGQKIVGAGRTDFAGLARAAGIGRVYSYDSLSDWSAGAAQALSGHGPAFIRLKIEARSGQHAPTTAPPMNDQLDRLMNALGTRTPPTGRATGPTSSTHARPVGQLTLRHDLRPGDLGYIVHLHGMAYAREYGFDPSFEAYVAGPLSEFVRSGTKRDRLWIAECADRIVGSIAIVSASEKAAQLRWYLVDPSARGIGVGKRLLHESITYCKQCEFDSVFLWTVAALTTAARLYRSVGFRKVEEKSAIKWGVPVVEEKYWLDLSR
jgi:GNAT superfamily N-acetyltransferase